MSGKPFDLEAAKRGEKVQYNYGNGEWADVHFVGVKKCGEIVFQHLIGSPYLFHPILPLLRMAPKPPKEMWVQWFHGPNGVIMGTTPRDSPDDARGSAKGFSLINEPQKVLVPDES